MCLREGEKEADASIKSGSSLNCHEQTDITAAAAAAAAAAAHLPSLSLAAWNNCSNTTSSVALQAE